MGREKEFYRDILELLNARYPGHDMLSVPEVMTVMGWKDDRTLRKHLGKYIVNGRICKPALARYMCG